MVIAPYIYIQTMKTRNYKVKIIDTLSFFKKKGGRDTHSIQPDHRAITPGIYTTIYIHFIHSKTRSSIPV